MSARSLLLTAVTLGTIVLGGCGLLLGDGLDVSVAAADASTEGGGGGGGTEGSVPSPTAPKPDGTCEADRKKCADLCVSLVDPAYGCAAKSCAPCDAPASTGAICTEGACDLRCDAGYERSGAACVKIEPSDTWKTLASMLLPRAALGAAASKDGRIFAIGGRDLTSVSSSVEAYSPSTNSWETLTEMPTARSSLAVVTAEDGRIFAIGGADASGTALATVEAYTPSTGTWETLPSMKRARYAIGAAVGSDGLIYVMGGLDKEPDIVGVGYYTFVEVYDPSTNSWADATGMSTPRKGAAATTDTNGRIVAVGGYTNPLDFEGTTSVEAYSPSTKKWALVAPLAKPRGAPGVVASKGRVFVIGGSDLSGPFKDVLAYTPSTNTWAPVGSMPTARYGFGAAVAPNGRIFVVGGATAVKNPVYTAKVEAYTP